MPLASPGTRSGIGQERDFQLAWIQIVSAMCADVVVFNSAYNRDAFLGGVPTD